jgi:tRNA(Ile)-lysidine synthase
MATIHDKVTAHIARWGMLDGVKSAVIALSGGPDSLALLHLMAELRASLSPGLTLTAAHLHHGMRGAAADGDAKFVAAQCETLGIPCVIENADIPALVHTTGKSEEVAGREARYAMLRRIAQAHGATRILTGHHADDQAETVLMRVHRGAGTRGLAAIPPMRADGEIAGLAIARPLLSCTRAEIEAYLREKGLTGRLDSSNLSLRYYRNRMRHTILPRLAREWNPSLSMDMVRLAASARTLHDKGEKIVSQLTQHHEVTLWPDYVEADAAWMRSLPVAVASELVRYWMEQTGLWRRAWGKPHFEAVIALLNTGGVAALPGECRAACSNDVLTIGPEREPALVEFVQALEVPGQCKVPALSGMIVAERFEGVDAEVMERIQGKGALEEYLDADMIPPSLTIRFPRPGDRMHPLGAPGSRKLQDILTDLRIPRQRRRRTVVVAAGEEIIWLAGCRIAESVRATSRTRHILHIRLSRGLESV